MHTHYLFGISTGSRLARPDRGGGRWGLTDPFTPPTITLTAQQDVCVTLCPLIEGKQVLQGGGRRLTDNGTGATRS